MIHIYAVYILLAACPDMCCLAFPAFAADDCKNAIALPYLTERLVGYTLAKNETPVCDYFLHRGWYRLKDFIIATSSKSCGTNTGWYMNGSLPTAVGDRKDVVVFSVYDNKTTQVIKCGRDDYAFQLEPVLSCSQAYCIESLHGPLPPGTLSPPDISYISPTLNVEVIDKNDNIQEHVFYCDFIPRDLTLFYEVEWSLSNGVSRIQELHRSAVVQYADKTDFRRKTKLSERHLHANGIVKIGYTLVCGLVARKNIAGLPSLLKTSSSKFFGFEILSKSPIKIDTLHPTAQITIQMTFPFRCPKQDGNCNIAILLYMPDIQPNIMCEFTQLATTQGTNCGQTFKPLDYLKPKNITIGRIIPERDNGGLPYIPYAVTLETMKFVSHEMIGDLLFDPIQVHASADNSFLSGKTCSAHSDPHMVSYDGLRFDCQHSGTFVMHRNIKYKEEVQFTTEKCSNFQGALPYEPWCVRAVAVRAGRDVFVADLKSNIVEFRNCQDGVLKDKVKKVGSKKYKIYLPTGTEIDLGYTGFVGEYFEIDIHPSVADHRNTEGLCGNFDGNISNDATTPVKVKPDDDLFNTANYGGLHPWDETFNLCNCSKIDMHKNAEDIAHSVNCDASQTIKCKDDRSKPTVRNQDYCSVSGRKKRDIHVSTETDFQETTDISGLTHFDRRRRSTVIYNETMAKDECSRAMNTTSVQLCSQLHGLDTTPYVDNCVLDAKVSRSMEWTQVHIESVKQVCMKHIKFHKPLPQDVLDKVNDILRESQNISNTTTDSTLTTTHQPTIVIDENTITKIKEASCPNDCSGQGSCQKGRCVCNKGFHDDDCSLDETQPPKIIGIPDKGKCDLRLRDCERTSVLGRRFLDSPSLSCQLKRFEFDRNQTKTDRSVRTARGTLKSFLEVTCPLPKARTKRSVVSPDDSYIARGYKVSISNNGVLFSAEDAIIIFDSTCVNCSKNGSAIDCVMASGFCMNNGRCYRLAERSGCYTCRDGGSHADKTWVADVDCVQVKTTDDVGGLWIYGAIFGPLAVLVLVSLGTAFVCSKQKMRSRRKLGSTDFSQEPVRK